jgi:serine phosphatase RsbU (regulator of sigma subunit)
MRMRPKGAGAYRWFLVRAVPHRDLSGRIDRWIGTTTDIDAQRRAFAALDFLAQSGARLAGAPTVDALLDRLAHASLEGLADISLFDLEEDGAYRRLVMTSPTLTPAQVALVRSFDAPHSESDHPIARAIRTATTVHLARIDDPHRDGGVDKGDRASAWRSLDVRSLVSAPMIVPDRVRGALTLVRLGTAAPFDAPEVNVIEEVARRAAVAIAGLRIGDREARAARDLQTFADMGESITGSVGLAMTLDAAIAVVVPARADWAYVTLADDRGELRLAAVAHPDDASQRTIAAHIGRRYETAGVVDPQVLEALGEVGFANVIVAPLVAGSLVRGNVHFCMSSDERQFTPSDVEFMAEFARRLAPAIANAELFDRERRVARSFQDASLPETLPTVPGFAFDAIYEAGKAEALVGGDWYDAFVLADGRIVISIGDVAGSGLSAAVTMSGVRQAIRGAAHVSPDPSVMLAAADCALQSAHGRFVTAFVGVIDPRTSTLTYQSAGHPPPLLALATGTVLELRCGEPPLGLRFTTAAASHTQALPAGSLLVLYTDGLTESRRDVLAGEARLRAALRTLVTAGADEPARMLHDAILVDGSRDDVAILTISVAG